MSVVYVDYYEIDIEKIIIEEDDKKVNIKYKYPDGKTRDLYFQTPFIAIKKQGEKIRVDLENDLFGHFIKTFEDKFNIVGDKLLIKLIEHKTQIYNYNIKNIDSHKKNELVTENIINKIKTILNPKYKKEGRFILHPTLWKGYNLTYDAIKIEIKFKNAHIDSILKKKENIYESVDLIEIDI
jgi:hypothetical protein